MLSLFLLRRVVQIAAGPFHSLAVDEAGGLYSTGKADDARLGRGGPAESWRRVSRRGTEKGKRGKYDSHVVDK